MPAQQAPYQKYPSFGMAGSSASGAVKQYQPSGPMTPLQQFINTNMPQYVSPLAADNTLEQRFQVSAGDPVQLGGRLRADTLDVNKFGANQDAVNAIKQRAMSSGESPWLRMQLDRLGVDELSARDRAGKQALAGSAQANAALAMRGGLSSGARERIATGGARDLNAMRQQIGRDVAGQRVNLGIADEETKMNLLSQIPSMDLAFANQRADLERFNINNKLNADRAFLDQQLAVDQYNRNMGFDADRFNKTGALQAQGGLNQFNLGKYQEMMKGYAADRTADAMRAGGGSGGPLQGLNDTFGAKATQNLSTGAISPWLVQVPYGQKAVDWTGNQLQSGSRRMGF